MIDVNTPVILPMGTGLTGRMADDEKQVLEEMEDAIAVATTNLGLVPGVAFQARVMQLAQLSTAHKTVCFTWPDTKLLFTVGNPWKSFNNCITSCNPTAVGISDNQG